MSELQAAELGKASLIASMPESFKAAYPLDGKDDYYFHRFAPFCHAYAEYLLNQGSYTQYGNFIDEYNEIIKQDETYQYYKEAQNSISLGLGVFSHNYKKAEITDKRNAIENDKFRFERDLENELIRAFKDYFGNELKVARQEYLGYGKSDLTLKDVVAIELKRGNALRKDVYQTFEYSFEKKVKQCCLIAAHFDESVLEISRKLKVDCYSYSFIYENVTGYPIGFWIEKVTSTDASYFDELLSEMDNAVYFTNYNPKFNFNEIHNEKFLEIEEIMKRTRTLIVENKKSILSLYQKEGYDTSKGLEHLLEQVKAKELAE